MKKEFHFAYCLAFFGLYITQHLNAQNQVVQQTNPSLVIHLHKRTSYANESAELKNGFIVLLDLGLLKINDSLKGCQFKRSAIFE